MQIHWVSREELKREVLRRLVPARQVLDVGTGICPQSLVVPQWHVCVEPHKSYVDRLQSTAMQGAHLLVINATWDRLMPLLPSGSIDAVYALDFIEHLTKEDGMAFLREAERVARRQVAVSTPFGFYPQSYGDDGEVDRWGLDGAQWQTHKSGWLPEDFVGNWQFVVCGDFYQSDQAGSPLPKPMGVLWALRTIDPAGASAGWGPRFHVARHRLGLRLALAAQRRLPLPAQLLLRRLRALIPPSRAIS